MIPINNDSKVFVLCPAYSKTGGPELLHQLVYELNRNNINAEIVYYNTGEDKNYTPNDFRQYVQTYALFSEISDCGNNYIIFPEVMTRAMAKFKKAKKIVWWLSVDNYSKKRGLLNSLKFYRVRGTLSLIHKGLFCINDSHLKRADYHLCQSYYAMDFLKKKGFKNVEYLSDYVNDYFLDIEPDYSKKEDIVLYNPKKGFNFTRKLIDRAPELNWTPIENLDTRGVRDLLLKGKVYIDFGNHPGKDRIPREAAMSGCCVITSKNGSAKFPDDVPIPEQYKFDDKDKNIDLIIKKIKQCLTNYKDEINQFEIYRQYIKAEKESFAQDVKKIFKVEQN